MDDHQRQDLYEMLGRLNATQDLILEGLKSHFRDDKDAFAKINEKMAVMDNKINYASGGLAVIGTGISIFGAWLAKKVGII